MRRTEHPRTWWPRADPSARHPGIERRPGAAGVCRLIDGWRCRALRVAAGNPGEAHERAHEVDGRAELEQIKHGYEDNRRLLLEGLPRAGLDSFLPVDGAFYLYADISRFSDDSFDFATRMLEEAGVAATPGVDFDPLHGRNFLRLCYAGTPEDMREAVERIGRWLQG